MAEVELVDVLAEPLAHARLLHAAGVRHILAQVFKPVRRRRLVVGPRHLPPSVDRVELGCAGRRRGVTS